MRFRLNPPLAIVLLLTLAMTACGHARREPTFGEEAMHFDSLAQMLATSDLVVEGTVESIAPGRVVGGTGDAAIQFDEVTLRIDRVFYGSVSTETVLLEDDAVEYSGSLKGDQGVYFLHKKTDKTEETYYRLVNSQGRFLWDGTKLAASNESYEWATTLETLTMDELEDQVVTASEKVASGEVLAATPELGG